MNTKKPKKLTKVQRARVESNYGLLWGFVAREVRRTGKQLTDDLISDLHLRLCRASQTYNPRLAKFSTYAYGGFILDKLTNKKREKDRRVRFKNQRFFRHPTYEIDFWKLTWDDFQKHFSSAELTIREQKILHLSFQNSLSLQEIGREMKLTKERVRQLKHEGLKKLRTYFDDKKITFQGAKNETFQNNRGRNETGKKTRRVES